jgi:hypothetical protein
VPLLLLLHLWGNSMTETIPIQVFVSDSRKALLYKGQMHRGLMHTRTASNGSSDSLPRVRLEFVERLESPWVEFHEHGRPCALGQGPSANAAQHFAGQGHEREEMEKRFAGQVAAWIAAQTRSAPEAAVVACADPRFLGSLRTACAAARVEIELTRGDFTWMRPAEIGAHPTIRSALDSARARVVPTR